MQSVSIGSILIGIILALIPIGLGIAALATPQWLEVNTRTFSLFICNNESNQTCLSGTEGETVKIFEIVGISGIAVGLIMAVLLIFIVKQRWIQLISEIFLTGGPILIFIGLILYAKYAIEEISRNTMQLTLGYSIIFIAVASVLGFCAAIYFAFVIGYGNRSDGRSGGRSGAYLANAPELTRF